MNFLLIVSIFIKGIAAVVEIIPSTILTNRFGVSSYGDYSYYVNLVEISYWVFFSGMIKLNAFYLSDHNTDIRVFRKKYLLFYFLPILLILFFLSLFSENRLFTICTLALVGCFFAFDRSSRELARGRGYKFLIGEYLVGRFFLMIAFLLFALFSKKMSLPFLLIIYGIQYLVILLWFRFSCGKKRETETETKVDLRKLRHYQQSDIAWGLIGQSPILLQHIFVGAYETGFVSIVVVIKKLVNFISGPVAKIFLPEFSRLYRENKKEEIRLVYRRIIEIQMFFVSMIGLLLVGFPDLVLRIFSPGLTKYTEIFRWSSVAFLLVSGLGPGSGLMQMTGQERKENHWRWITILLMVAVWILTMNKPLFALYGLLVQAVAEGLIKYFLICKWFQRSPISFGRYALLWIPVFVISVGVKSLGLDSSFLALIVCSMLCMVLTGCILLMDPDIRSKIIKILHVRLQTSGGK